MKVYALITGASTGFGKALAMEYAKRSMNLIIVSLPDSGLNKLGDFLRSNFKIKVMSFELDLSDKHNCRLLFEKVKEHNASVKYLINNAGVLSCGFFEDLSEDYFLKQIKVNVATPTILTKLFLEDLKTNSPSGILNVGSMASFFHLSKKQVYGGTKAYLWSFTQSLRKELKQYGISVSIVCPGGMNTTNKLCVYNRKLKGISRYSILDPEEVAKNTLCEFDKGKAIIIPGKVNRTLLFLASMLPNVVINRLTSNVP